MCGITGILDWQHAPDPAEVRAMTQLLHHRGPDASGFHHEGPIALGHARLSIIDLEGGVQPMANAERQLWLTFNGEIFNHVELRRSLQARGRRFATRSDTEVILHAYAEYGDACVEHLNGQFAFALWDARRQRLLLARDRVGIRPLFYTRLDGPGGGRFAFASEVKALFALPDVPRRLDVQALGEIFTTWAPLSPHVVFAGVHSLGPGECMVVDAQGSRSWRYWDWSFPAQGAEAAEPYASADEAAEALRALLLDCVRLQLRADVPVGAYLSGGLDSSVITTLIHHHTSSPLRTFSLTFDDAEFDESAEQRLLVDHLGCEHTTLHCTRADIAAAFPLAVFHAESPILRTAPAPLMLLAQHVRDSGYKVVLTGEGADEVFGGYDLFKEARVRRFMARQPQSAWRGALLERLYPYLRHSPAAGRALAQRFFADGAEHLDQPGFGHLPRWTTTQRTWQFFSPSVRERLGRWNVMQVTASLVPPAFAHWQPLQQDQYIEAHTLMSGYLLCSQGDRMAMAHSIEGRFPFLDHRLIAFANRLPPRYKLMGLTEKWLLKHAMRGLLPENIRTRTKQPYRAPDSQSFFEQGKPVDYAAELMSPGAIADAGYFDPAAVSKLFAKCRAGRAIGFADNMAFVGVLSTMLLHRQFVAMPPATPQAREYRTTAFP